MTKLFLLTISEENLARLSLLTNIFQFVEVQGLDTPDGKHRVLVNPIPPTAEDTPEVTNG